MKKKLITILLALCLCCSVTACGFSDSSKKNESISQEEKEPLDLTGTWADEDAGDSYQEAVITGSTIEINFISDNGKTRSLYWNGTYDAPSENTKQYTWTSKRNKEKTDTAILSSQDDSKVFTYENGKITYEVSAMGTTTTMELSRTSEDVPGYYKTTEPDTETVEVPEKTASIFENDALTTDEAIIKITGIEVIQGETDYSPYLLVFTYDFTNNSQSLISPEDAWYQFFFLTQETESTINNLGVTGNLPTDSEYKKLEENMYNAVKPGATVQSVHAYAIEDISTPVTLTVSDNYGETVLGTKIINLQ